MKFFLLLLVAVLGFDGVVAAAAQKNESRDAGAEICDRFEPQLQKLTDDKEFLEAVKALADYEHALLDLYPAPKFEHGVYQNQAHHLSVRSGFEGWKEQPKENLRVPVWVSITGFDMLLGLEGPSDDQKFAVSSVDTGRIERRLGQQSKRPDATTDQELIQASRMIANNLGTIQTQQFKIFSGRRTLVSELRGRGGATVTTAIIGSHGVLYRFALSTSEAKKSDDEKKFFKTLDGVQFDFKSANTEKIERIRVKAKEAGIRDTLAEARKLVLIGEFGAAVEELAHVRMLIGQQMPGPHIEGNLAKYPLYGISLSNPDPDKWKLSATNQAGIGMLILEDRFSIAPTAVMVMVLNTVLMYGPQFVDAVIDNTNEQIKKDVLAGAGRGGLGRVGNKLESETFRMFRGMMAYQGIAVANTPNSKVKAILTANANYLLMIIEMTSDHDFEAKTKELDEIVDKNLELKAK